MLVVDRYRGYNKAPCKIQYCYEHLKREVEDLETQFGDNQEVKVFVRDFAQLGYRSVKAIKLRTLPITDKTFYRRALRLKKKIIKAVEAPAQHLGIRHIQDIFYDNPHRMYHENTSCFRAEDRRIPADNNLAERELRPTVIARKVSFGSQSEQGAKTREILMSILHTLNKHTDDVVAHFKAALDQLALDPSLMTRALL